MDVKTLKNGMSCILCLLLLSFFSMSVTAESKDDSDIKFRHSPKGLHALLAYNKSLESLLDEYKRTVKDVDERFVRTTAIQVSRYTGQMERESRTLTRDSKFEPARAAMEMIKTVKALPIVPPDAEGAHFLSFTQLEIPGGEDATQLGLDLLLQIERQAVLHSKQYDAVFAKYKQEVESKRTNLREELERVLEFETRSGRIDAMDEVRAALAILKKPAALEQIKPRPGKAAGDNKAGDSNDDSTTPGEVDLFLDVDGTKNGNPVGTKKKGDSPSWAGYYLLKYTNLGRQGADYVVRLDETGGKVLFYSSDGSEGNRDSVSLPIKMAKGDDDNAILLKHDSGGIRDSILHRLVISNGQISSAQLWYSDQAYERKDQPDQTGRVIRLGTPGADLLGLPDGVYHSDRQMHVWKNNKPKSDRGRLEITVDNGFILLTRHQWGNNKRTWDSSTAFVFKVETKGDQLILHYDQNEFTWPDCFVIDLSDRSQPTLKHWWRHDWRTRGDSPSSTGKLVPARD